LFLIPANAFEISGKLSDRTIKIKYQTEKGK
jgi:hypothetical protein